MCCPFQLFPIIGPGNPVALLYAGVVPSQENRGIEVKEELTGALAGQLLPRAPFLEWARDVATGGHQRNGVKRSSRFHITGCGLARSGGGIAGEENRANRFTALR
jgi:hypothetical protein